jgi:hypothetical protein
MLIERRLLCGFLIVTCVPPLVYLLMLNCNVWVISARLYGTVINVYYHLDSGSDYGTVPKQNPPASILNLTNSSNP